MRAGSNLTEIKEMTEFSNKGEERRSQSFQAYTLPKPPIIEGDEEEIVGNAIEGHAIVEDRNEDVGSVSSGGSNDSENIRKQAEKILQTYQTRLKKVGKQRFQLRLNIFFSFVMPTSIEAEAYDYIQSVEGSVMNYSDDGSSIVERVYERTNTLSQISQQ